MEQVCIVWIYLVMPLEIILFILGIIEVIRVILGINTSLQFNRFMFRSPAKELRIGSVYITSKEQLVKIVKMNIYSYEDSNGGHWRIRFHYFRGQALYDLNKRDLRKHWPKMINNDF